MKRNLVLPCVFALLLLGAGCGPEPFELTSHVTTGESGRLAFWWQCLSSKCSIVGGAPVNYTELAGRQFELVVESADEDGSVLVPLTFTSSDESRLVVVSSACNPSCVRDSARTCGDASLDCPAPYGYLLRLDFLMTGDTKIEAHTLDGALYDDVVFPVTPATVP